MAGQETAELLVTFTSNKLTCGANEEAFKKLSRDDRPSVRLLRLVDHSSPFTIITTTKEFAPGHPNSMWV